MEKYASISYKIFLFYVISMLFLSCGRSTDKLNLSENEKIKIKIVRFDSAIISLNTNNLQIKNKEIASQYSSFYNIFFNDLLHFNTRDTSEIISALIQYKHDTTFSKVNKEVIKKFENIEDIENEVSDAFSIFHYYYKDKKLPKIFFFVSGFNRSVIYNDSLVGIGVDMYLGRNFPFYEGISYNYMKYGMDKKFIPVDIVSSLISANFKFDSNEDRLLDYMLYKGKLIYFLSVLLDKRNISDLMVYTPEQTEWCEKYEKEIWATVVEKKFLFSTDNQLITKFMNDAPFTGPVAQESPGRLGAWLGWRIVESYMKNNPAIKIPDLMNTTNYRKILQESGYRP